MEALYERPAWELDLLLTGLRREQEQARANENA